MLSDLIITSNIINVTSVRDWRVFPSQGSVNSIITSQAVITLSFGVAFSSLNSHSWLGKFPCYFKLSTCGSLADSEYASITYFTLNRASFLLFSDLHYPSRLNTSHFEATWRISTSLFNIRHASISPCCFWSIFNCAGRSFCIWRY